MKFSSIIIAIYLSLVASYKLTADTPFFVYRNDETIVGVYADYSNVRSLQSVEEDSVQIKYPETEGYFRGYIDKLEFFNEKKETIALLKKFHYLVQRQKELEENGTYDEQFSRHLPVQQMITDWIVHGYLPEPIKHITIQGKLIDNRLGGLLLYTSKIPPMGIFNPDYRQPSSDLSKAYLFQTDGRFFSIYGDTQLAEHVPLLDYPGRKGALRYAGNPLYAVSKELPPGLQTCGIDEKGVIWLADVEGHVAFFNINTKEFEPTTVNFHDVLKLKIPRDNFSSSIFVWNNASKMYVEKVLAPDRTVTSKQRELPADTVQVLHSDSSKVVYVTHEEAVLMSYNATESRRVKFSTTHIQPPERELKNRMLTPDIKVMEGVYFEKSREVAALIANRPNNESYLWDVRASWKNMHLITVQFDK